MIAEIIQLFKIDMKNMPKKGEPNMEYVWDLTSTKPHLPQ